MMGGERGIRLSRYQVSSALDAAQLCNTPPLFCRADELEGVDDLFAVRMLVNLAGGSVGEFVLVVCRYWIAEHQRVDDPDSTWLHVPMTPLLTGRWSPSR